ncbi:AmpG family muropeptide MFS transporter [Methylorubrum extorquens]|uniref:Transport transmembrane protein, AmpG n=1 Tax=Methylorubrum extorquens (strain ATCC 14718 / DSM 1338 / JCM 2805 / NCIMB 9133 / AM1) TaxID=272630 RepID=C5B329_METEA|nr:AmpG family muropeptide MFS transporter [Methylorubrum extorquens]ACS42059.1 putative transport transmembrane protein, AmpG [Methylorubrum extorquens AM1]MCP1544891.1 PAT family beta-lactamase induction signal transducer AmpG [Methylorubrum extorquens]MCP1587762.1 PAT family beta-lactamase induction signal transducer AmpG [Methylorubrum extorquens]
MADAANSKTFPKDTPLKAQPRKLRLRDITEDKRVAQMLALGFSSGLPLLLVLGTFTLRLADSGIDIKTIGLFSYVALPYSLKFLWAPSIDRVDVPFLAPRLGRKRAWMIVTQIATALALVLMAFADPKDHLALIGLGAFLVAFCAATQDVVIDGWRIEAAGTDLQGIMAATSNLGYRFGLILAGAGALYVAAYGGWMLAYLCMAALMGVGLIAALLATPYDRPREAATGKRDLPAAVRRAVLEPLTELYARMGKALFAVLALVALYRMPDFVSGVMANPLYITLGYGKAEIATIVKLFGIWVGIAGGFAGGWSIARLGMFPTLVIGAFIAAASHLSLAWLALGEPEQWRLAIAVSIESLCGSFAGIALIAYMSSLTTPGFAATQYALFSSLYALPGKLVAGTSGFVVAAYGFPAFFAMTAAVGIPVVALCFAVGRIPQRTAPAESPAEATPEAVQGNPTGPVGLASAEAGPEIPPKVARAQT